jgi:cytochrome bd-type quinol oxidase subunit 1
MLGYGVLVHTTIQSTHNHPPYQNICIITLYAIVIITNLFQFYKYLRKKTNKNEKNKQKRKNRKQPPPPPFFIAMRIAHNQIIKLISK